MTSPNLDSNLITLVTKLGATDYDVRARAASALVEANDPRVVELLIDVLDNDPDIGVVYPDVDRVAEIDGEPFGKFTWAEGDIDVLLKGCFLGPMPMWRKSLHDEYGLFDPEMHSSGDYDFWLRLAKAGVKMHRIAEPLGAYFDRPESIEHREPIRTTWETARSRGRHRE